MVIDVDKFVASLIKYYCEAHSIDRTIVRCWFEDVLEEQGLEYKDGEIVKTQRRIAAEAEENNDCFLAYWAELPEQSFEKNYWFEKQGEQSDSDVKDYTNIDPHFGKPVDKVEPKFKVGDWVVNRFGDVWHIDSLDKKNYQVSNKGKYNYFPIAKQDEMRLWTIDDANNGDILASGNIIIMCKLGSDSENNIYSYCSLDNDGKFTAETETDWLAEYFYPATKEQRDILEKAMTNAGYTFDFDNEELKKLSQSVTKISDKVWSEEDEEELGIAIKSLQQAGQWDSVTWLKSLKERIGGK